MINASPEAAARVAKTYVEMFAALLVSAPYAFSTTLKAAIGEHCSSAKPAAQVAKTYVPLMPHNVVHLGALLGVEMLAVMQIRTSYSCFGDTFLKTVTGFSVRS